MRKFHLALVFFGALALVFIANLGVGEATLGKTLSSALLPSFHKAEITEQEVLPAGDVEVGPFIAPADEQEYGTEITGRVGIDAQRLEPLPPAQLATLDEETLWLARCIFSETKRAEEQELVGWVVRNRVESGYRGKYSYREVVLDEMQFSAFNPGERTREFYSALTAQSRFEGWQRALRIAHEVRKASPLQRPFSAQVRHFYSLQSMVGQKDPVWAKGMEPVAPKREFTLEDERFRFIAEVD